MKIIYNRFIPFRGFRAVNLFGVVFARREFRPLPERTIRHETIHSAQMRELCYVLFYLLFSAEWLVRRFGRGKIYRRVSFEREAYAHEYETDYLCRRKRFAQWR